MSRKIGWPKALYGDFKNATILDQHQHHYCYFQILTNKFIIYIFGSVEMELELRPLWFATYHRLIKALRSTAYEWFEMPVSNDNDFTDKVSPFTV